MEIKDESGKTFEIDAREIMDVDYNKTYAKCYYSKTRSEEVEIADGSLQSVLMSCSYPNDIQKFQIYNKRHILIDDIDLWIPCNQGVFVYNGEKINALRYYSLHNEALPIGEFDPDLGREITFNDLCSQTYVVYKDGTVDKNPSAAMITISELIKLYGKQSQMEVEQDKPKMSP